MAKVVKVQGIKPTEKLILLLLANYANDTNTCYPSYDTIAKLSNCSRRTAIKTINSLARQGLISVQTRRLSNKDNQSNIYTLNTDFKDFEGRSKTPSAVSAPPSANYDTNPSAYISPPSANSAPNTITINNQIDTITLKGGKKIFDEFRKKYQGKKRGLDTEFKNFTKHKDWREVLKALSIINQKDLLFHLGADISFHPHLQRFINNRMWEMIEPQQAQQQNWWETRVGIETRGQQFGLSETNFSSFQPFRMAVLEKAKESGEAVA